MALRHFKSTRDWVSTTRKPLLGEKSRSRSNNKNNNASKSRSAPNPNTSRSKRSGPPLTDLPARVARKAFSVVSAVGELGAGYRHSSERRREKGLPMPVSSRQRKQSQNQPKEKEVSRTMREATRPVAPVTVQTPPVKAPIASRFKTPAPPPKASQPQSRPSLPPKASAANGGDKPRHPVVKSKSLPNTTKEKAGKVNPITPPPKAKINGSTSKAKNLAPVVRRKTNG